MLRVYATQWWALLIRGIAAVVFGILALVWPGLTVGMLVILFGAYVLVDGIFTLVHAFTGRNEIQRWWMVAIEGISGMILGLLVLFWPQITALVLLYFIAAWAVITGIMEIIAAYQLRKEIQGEWLLVLAGVASIAFGIMAFVVPGTGALALITFIAAFIIVFGVALILLAFRVRSHASAVSNQ